MDEFDDTSHNAQGGANNIENDTYETNEKEIHKQYPDNEKNKNKTPENNSPPPVPPEETVSTVPQAPPIFALSITAEDHSKIEDDAPAFAEDGANFEKYVWELTAGQCDMTSVRPNSKPSNALTLDGIPAGAVFDGAAAPKHARPPGIYREFYDPRAESPKDEGVCEAQMDRFFENVNNKVGALDMSCHRDPDSGLYSMPSKKQKNNCNKTSLLGLLYLLKKMKALPQYTALFMFLNFCHSNTKAIHDALRKMVARILAVNCAGEDGLSRGTCITDETLRMIAEWLEVYDDEAKCSAFLAKYSHIAIGAYTTKDRRPKFIYLNFLDNRYYRVLVNDELIFFHTTDFLKEKLLSKVTQLVGVIVIAADFNTPTFPNLTTMASAAKAKALEVHALICVVDIHGLDERSWDEVRIVKRLHNFLNGCKGIQQPALSMETVQGLIWAHFQGWGWKSLSNIQLRALFNGLHNNDYRAKFAEDVSQRYVPSSDAGSFETVETKVTDDSVDRTPPASPQTDHAAPCQANEDAATRPARGQG